ncbi:MAG: tetratricopeptide repeat protein [Planctomycetota bacterium]|jgi:tetratricopeptide (TPR) repeat protein
MQCGKTTLLILVASLPGLMPVLYSAATAFAEVRPSEPPAFPATPQQQAAAFLRKELPGLIESVLRDFPEDAYLTLVAFKFYQQCKNPRKAMAFLEEGLKHHPKHFDLNKMAAKAAFNNGDYEKAIRFGRQALTINVKNPTVHEDLAEAMLFSGQYPQAVEVLDSKVALLGDSERSCRLLGKGYSFLKNYQKAIDYYEKADQMGSGLTIADYSNMSKLYMRLKQPEKAKAYMKRHSEMTAVKKTRELKDATKKKDRVILDSSDSEVYVFSRVLARLCTRGRTLYLNQQKPEEAETIFSNAEDIFNQSVSIAPDTADIYREFANMYVTTGKNLNKALPLAQKSVALEGSVENFSTLGRAYYKNSDLEKALWAFEQALKQEPQNKAIRQAYNSIMEMRY